MRTILMLLAFGGVYVNIAAQTLPQEWVGKWVGVVNIWSQNRITDSFPMSLEISPNDTVWNFILTYQRNPEKPDVREYSFIIIDDSTGHFAIDEHNSIILDTYLNGECFYTSFGGLGSELLTRMCLSDHQLEYEITSTHSEPIRVSGNEIVKNDTMPTINSYQVYHVMRARLSKE